MIAYKLVTFRIDKITRFEFVVKRLFDNEGDGNLFYFIYLIKSLVDYKITHEKRSFYKFFRQLNQY